MPGNTPVYGWQYPDATQPDNVPYWLQAALEAIEATVADIAARVPVVGEWQPVTAGSGITSTAKSKLFTLDGVEVVMFAGELTKTSGNFVTGDRNAVLGTITAAHRPIGWSPDPVVALGSSASNAGAARITIGTDGTIRPLPDTGTLTAHSLLRLDGLWLPRLDVEPAP